jgi:predicted AAA+ superfamily ATPase
LTGSVEPATYGPTYPLTGRAVRVVMRPMTMAELAGRGDGPTLIDGWAAGERPRPTAGRSARFDLDTLSVAGFPAVRLLGNSAMFLEGYAALVAQRGGDEGRDASRLLKTMRVLATLESQAVPDQRIWEAADINKATWKAYDDLLARTHLTAPSPAFQSNRLKRLTSYPKRYFADTALALTLAGVTRAQLDAEPKLAGQYVESFVMQQLRPQLDLVGAELNHLRTGAGEREVDAVFEIGGSVYAVEVKHRANVTSADGNQLAWLRDQLGGRFAAGFVVHTGADVSELGDRLWGIPLAPDPPQPPT